MVIQWMRSASLMWLIATVACGGGSLEPQPLPLDRVNCARCRMLISDHAHAAQAVAPGEEPRFYDDRGCLASDARTLPAGARLFVQLDRARGWIDVRKAFFAFPRDVRTPMDYGLTAYRTEAEAIHADRGGRALRWDAVVHEIEARKGMAQR